MLSNLAIKQLFQRDFRQQFGSNNKDDINLGVSIKGKGDQNQNCVGWESRKWSTTLVSHVAITKMTKQTRWRGHGKQSKHFDTLMLKKQWRQNVLGAQQSGQPELKPKCWRGQEVLGTHHLSEFRFHHDYVIYDENDHCVVATWGP